jgi:porphobilinogen synthase
MPYPLTRPRRLRIHPMVRDLVQESQLLTQDLIYPLFVVPGSAIKEAIPSLPGIYHYSIDTLIEEAKEASSLGLRALILFPVVPNRERTALAEKAYASDGLIQTALRALKKECPQMALISDVALDPFTLDGHDGVCDEQGIVDNDKTIALLIKQALSHAEAGADIIAPSDMMDGRIRCLRDALEKNGYHHTALLSYTAKYASTLYGPFRSAIGSQGVLKGDKCNYQMNPANSKEALFEAELDLEEGADILMVKPGLPYLDIVASIKEKFQKPTFSYMVSGEYAMIKNAVDKKILPPESIVEMHLCMRRAGADAIISYFAKSLAHTLRPLV